MRPLEVLVYGDVNMTGVGFVKEIKPTVRVHLKKCNLLQQVIISSDSAC